MAGYDMLCCVVNMGDASKLLKIAGKYGVRGGTISIGRGTVQNRILEFLKINEIRKEFVSMVVETDIVTEAIQGISRDMGFDKPHHGIAFSHRVSEVIVNCKDMKDTDNEHTDNQNMKVKEVKEIMYNAIYVVVEKGKAEDVIEAATEAGARGGTILNARGASTQEMQKFFSLEIEPEKEKVFIITKADQKDVIVEAINQHLKEAEESNGIIYVLDVNEAYGLH